MKPNRTEPKGDVLPVIPSNPPQTRCGLNRAEQALYYLLLALVLGIVCVLITGVILGWWWV